MKVKSIVEQIERMFGRQPEQYIFQLINDGLIDIAGNAQHYSRTSKTNLESYQRWYDLDDKMIDIMKVEILDTNDRYVMIPKLADYHKLLKGDTDEASGSLT